MKTRTRLSILVAAVSPLSACFHVPSDAQMQAEAEFLSARAAATASRIEAGMQVDQRAAGEMQATAAACGTSLVFTPQPGFGTVAATIDPRATPGQIACVQQHYPSVKATSR